MLLNDNEIFKLCDKENGMIQPFEPNLVKQVYDTKVLSYGLGSFGYDISIGDIYKLYNSNFTGVIDPKHIDPAMFYDYSGEVAELPPNSSNLAHSYEYFNIPPDIEVICLGKSTYARAGLLINVTPLEAGWRGVLTIELVNLNPRPIKIYSFEGIAQLLFFRGKRPQVTYADRAGKYQNQVGIVLPRV